MEVMRGSAEPVPEGWYRREEIFTMLKLKHSSGTRVLRKIIGSGRVDRKEFRVETKLGVRAIPHYRLL